MTLGRKYLVPLKQEFARIRRGGKMYDSPSFGMLVAYGTSGRPQCAFIVSKKIDRRSVVRHEVKRKLSDTVQPFLPRLPKNLELVFLAKPKAVTISKDELYQEVLAILNRARLTLS